MYYSETKVIIGGLAHVPILIFIVNYIKGKFESIAANEEEVKMEEPKVKVVEVKKEEVKKEVVNEIAVKAEEVNESEVKKQIDFFVKNKGTKSVDHFHKRLGKVMWDKVGMSRNIPGLKEAIKEIKK